MKKQIKNLTEGKILRQKAEDLEVAVEKYIDLYDFASTGYLTLAREGQIIGLNLCASKMLGKERSRLMKNMFSTFVTNDSKQKFYHFLKEIFNTQVEQYCEVTLFHKGKLPIIVYLIGHNSKDGLHYDISIIDITERKDAERKMNDLLNKVTISNKELEDFAYVASHDLQEPLRMVTSFMQLLSIKYKDNLDDIAHEYIHLDTQFFCGDKILLRSMECPIMAVNSFKSNI